MKRIIPLLLTLAASNSPALAGAEPGSPCSDDWYRFVEKKVVSGDGQGHGPDLGSDEWKGVVEFKLGIRGEPGLPARDSQEWCDLIDKLVREQP